MCHFPDLLPADVLVVKCRPILNRYSKLIHMILAAASTAFGRLRMLGFSLTSRCFNRSTIATSAAR